MIDQRVSSERVIFLMYRHNDNFTAITSRNKNKTKIIPVFIERIGTIILQLIFIKE